MKKKFTKILGVGLTLALLTSLLLTAAPVSALSAPAVTLATGTSTISSSNTDYTITFELGKELTAADTITVTLPVGTVVKSPYGTGNISLTDTVDVATITDATGGDSGVITITTGTVAITGTGTIGTTPVTGPGSSTWSTTAGQTIIITPTTAPVAGSWTATTGTGVMTLVDADSNSAIPAADITCGPGWINSLWDSTPDDLSEVTWAVNATLRTITATLVGADEIGETADVRINLVNCVQNPATSGTDFTLTVGTMRGTTVREAAVTSAAYAITAPTILPLPGVVERYNSAGVLMAQTNSIQEAINASSAGDTILVGAGTYDEDLTINQSVAITGDAATTIIKDTNGNLTGGTVTISYVGTATTAAIFDGFTVMGDLTANGDALTITGHKVTVQNCIFTKAGIATTAVAQDMIYYNPGALPTLVSTITNCTFDTTLGTVVDNGILIAAGANAIGLTVSNNTFTVDGAIALEDSAVNTSGVGTALLPITISGNTITGGSGIGVTFTAGVATASDNTLSGLNQAFLIVAGAATIKGNTIDNCGLVVSTTAAVGKAAIGVTATTALAITNNTIINGPNDIIEIVDNSENINMMFNNLTDNAIGIDNNDADIAQTLNATHNWWGAATGPATGFNLTAGAVNDTTSYLGGEATGTFTNAAVTSLLTKTTVGVDVTLDIAITAVDDIIGVANYAANPQDATPLPALDGGFYDVYLEQATTSTAVSSVLIKFYNANITANTDVYVWGTIAGGWQPCTTQGVNTYGDYAYVTVTTTTPDIAGLAGTPFALVEATPTALTAPTISSPDVGDDTVRLRPVFAWLAVPGADGYYFQLADNADFVVPLVKMEGDTGRLSGTTYAYVGEALPYSTPYHWRVKAVSGTIGAGNLAESAWAGGVFITMDEPVEPTPPVVVEEAPPVIIEPIVEVEVITPATTEITPAWIYVIIGVGGVLVIALLVLIVRTRRVA